MSEKDEELWEDKPQYVEILQEDGTTIKCEVYDVVDFENKTYALLIPQDEDDDNSDEEDIIVMQYVDEDEDNPYFETIDDDDEFNRVCEYIQSLTDEDEDGEE